MTPAEVNAEIAKLRGWDDDGGPGRSWRFTSRTPPHEARIAAEDHCMGDEPPPYCELWQFAGPLLEEMAGPTSGACVVYAYDGPGAYSWVATPSPLNPNGTGAIAGESADTPCEAIGRAWLAWRRAQS